MVAAHVDRDEAWQIWQIRAAVLVRIGMLREVAAFDAEEVWTIYIAISVGSRIGRKRIARTARCCADRENGPASCSASWSPSIALRNDGMLTISVVIMHVRRSSVLRRPM